MTRKAFTLIELLVVIAIIAILAAILFPVFAQAKEAAKKTQTLNNIKQLAVSSLIYVSDYDDTFPLGMLSGGTGTTGWRITRVAPVPADWCATYATAVSSIRPDYNGNAMNAVFPYVKAFGLYSAAGQPTTRRQISTVEQACWANNPNTAARAKVAFAFNGLLQSYSSSAVARPSQNTLFWQYEGKANNDGFNRSSPVLNCSNGSLPCTFVPDQYPQGSDQVIIQLGADYTGYGYVWFWATALVGNSSAWVYGKGLMYASTDSSARHTTVNCPSSDRTTYGPVPRYGQANPKSNFSRFDSASAPGTPYYSADCSSKLDGAAPSATNIAYDCFFRPDSEYTYTNATAADY